MPDDVFVVAPSKRKKRQTRSSFSLSYALHKALREHCSKHNIPVATYVEAVLRMTLNLESNGRTSSPAVIEGCKRLQERFEKRISAE